MRRETADTILVVDDNIHNLQVISRTLENQGYEIMIARSGEDGLAKAQRGQPDLILLDVLMPGIDGFETCRRLKADPSTQNIPVLFMTALDSTADKLNGFSVGGVDYITKPFQTEEVMARVQTHLMLYRLQRQQRALFRRFATKEVANELLESGIALGGRYVEATAMFSDIRSFTTLTESQSPADIIELLNDYFAHMIDAISSQGGIVNQIVGDGLMAIFGAPVAHENHRQRAVQAALKMMERIEIFNREQAEAGKVQIQIGIGIASGRVIAGYLGTEVRTTYTCIGDPVNTAARLEGYTKVLGHPILIDDVTRSALPDDFPVIDHGLTELKGKTNLVHIYAVPPAAPSENFGVNTVMA